MWSVRPRSRTVFSGFFTYANNSYSLKEFTSDKQNDVIILCNITWPSVVERLTDVGRWRYVIMLTTYTAVSIMHLSVGPIVSQLHSNSTSSGASVQHEVSEQTVRARSLSPGYSSNVIYRVVLGVIHLFHFQYRRWLSAMVTCSVLHSCITH